MAEAASDATEREENDPAKRVRPPDRKKHEEDLDLLNVEIKAKEALMKSLGPRGEDGLPGQLREIRSEKEDMIQNCRGLDAELKHVNIEIGKRKESLARIETGLQYKNEDKINEAIRRLEHQLKTTNYNLREEKKIVAEIDRLKRSKKLLVQYNSEKKDVDMMRDRQRRMREQRDHFYKGVKALKTKEEHLKKGVREGREKSEVIKKELDELYAKKRSLQSEFKKQDREFNDHRNELRRKRQEEYRMRREEERQMQQQQYQKDLAEYEASREPYEDEKQLCRTLSAYLQRYLVDEAGDKTLASLPQEGNTCADQVGSQDVAEPEGMKVLKKKDDLDLYGGVKPKVTKKKKEKKKTLNKVVHTPEVLSQFLQIGLQAPSSVSDVPASIKQLKEKLEYYFSLPPPAKSDLLNDKHSDKNIGAEGSSDGSTPSVGESAICESVPSTPEVLNDNAPPRLNFDPKNRMDELWPQPRRISRDSGTELEESDIHDMGQNIGQSMSQSNEVSHMTSNDLHNTKVGLTVNPTDLDNNPLVAVGVETSAPTSLSTQPGSVSGTDLKFNFTPSSPHLVTNAKTTNQNNIPNTTSLANNQEQLQQNVSAEQASFIDNPQDGDTCKERPLESKGGILNHNMDSMPSNTPINERLGDLEVLQPVS